MPMLLSECHFWTIRDDIRIRATDLGAFRYMRNRELHQQQHRQSTDCIAHAKRDYTCRRNGILVPKNSRKAGRLKDNIKKLEELMQIHKIVYSYWRDAMQVVLLFANGIIAHICVDTFTGDILRILFEKYFVGKLAAETITDAFFTRSHIVLAYNTNQLTVVHLQKQIERVNGPEKISNMDPHIFHVIMPGPAERKLARHISMNSSVELFVVWTKSSQNEVYPWRPTVRDQDWANIHVFKMKNTQLEAMGYCWSENDPLVVEFLRTADNQLLTVEQKISRKGDISAEICTYQICNGKMQRALLSSIAVHSEICCYSLSPDQEKLFLGTIDQNVYLHDMVQQTTKFLAHIEIIPTMCTWHCDSGIIMIANERIQFQCFDLALATIAVQLQCEEITSRSSLSLAHYFTTPTSLRAMSFSAKPDMAPSTLYAQTDCFLLLIFDGGPIACVRFYAGTGMRGDIHNSGLTADVLVENYLSMDELKKAVNLLVALNWETYGAMCLMSLHKIANYVFYHSEHKREHIQQMRKALSTFSDTLSEETQDDFSDHVFDVKRRFFFYLLRNDLFPTAFEIAQDIEDYDLFMDLFNTAKLKSELLEFAGAAFSQAVAILHEDEQLKLKEKAIGNNNYQVKLKKSDLPGQQRGRGSALKNYVPPLPSVTSRVLSAEIKINIPKPELRLNTKLQQQETHEFQRNSTSVRSQRDSLDQIADRSNGICSAYFDRDEAQKSTKLSNGDSLLSAFRKSVPDQTLGIPTASSEGVNQCFTTTNYSQLSVSSKHVGASNQMAKCTTAKIEYASPVAVVDQSPAGIRAPNNGDKLWNGYQPRIFRHPLISGTIPPTSMPHMNEEYQKRLIIRKSSTSILSNSLSLSNACSNGKVPSDGIASAMCSKIEMDPAPTAARSGSGEKNKVKFSDTVQIAVVPDIPRKDKPITMRKNGASKTLGRCRNNPKQELADSLPLCHPNDEYLKDFNPLTTENPSRPQRPEVATSQASSAQSSSIKVVHFGVV